MRRIVVGRAWTRNPALGTAHREDDDRIALERDDVELAVRADGSRLLLDAARAIQEGRPVSAGCGALPQPRL